MMRFRFVWVCSIVVVLAFGCIPARNASAATTMPVRALNELLAKANKALLAGKYEEARDAFESARESDPKNADACHGAAIAYFRLDDLVHARETMERAYALEEAPERSIVLNLAALEIRVQNPMRGAKAIRDYLALNPDALDERMLDTLGAALSVVDAESAKAKPYQQLSDYYDAYAKKIEAKNPGKKKWGPEWLPADEVDGLRATLSVALRNIAQLEDELEQLKKRSEDAKRNVAGKQERLKNHRATQQDVDKAQEIYAGIESERRSKETDHNRAVGDLSRPKFSDEYDLVLIDDNTPPTIGATVAVGTYPLPARAVAAKDDAAGGNPDGAGSTKKEEQGIQIPPAKLPAHGPVAAFPIAPDLFVTTAGPFAGMTEARVQLQDGATVQAKIVRQDPKSGLALVRLIGRKANFLALAPDFAGGELEYAGFPVEGLFELTAEIFAGRASKPVKTPWAIQLEQTPRIVGGPLLCKGKIVGAITLVAEGETGVAPGITLSQLREFLGADLPRQGSTNPDPATVVLQLTLIDK